MVLPRCQLDRAGSAAIVPTVPDRRIDRSVGRRSALTERGLAEIVGYLSLTP
jgi:hypothetical protein